MQGISLRVSDIIDFIKSFRRVGIHWNARYGFGYNICVRIQCVCQEAAECQYYIMK